MPTTEQNQKMESLIRSLPIPSRSIDIFGVSAMNIHIKCESIKSARKWVSVLNRFCREVKCVESLDDRADNHKRINAPKYVPCYLIIARV